MKFLFVEALLLLIIQISFANRLKLFKKDKVLESALRNIVVDNRLTGFLACNLFDSKKSAPDVLARSNNLLRQANSLADCCTDHSDQ